MIRGRSTAEYLARDRRPFEVVLDLAFQATDCENVTSSEVVGDASYEQTQAFRLVWASERPLGRDVPRLLVLATDSVVERPERLPRSLRIGGDAPLDGTGQFQQISIDYSAHRVRAHVMSLALLR